MKSKKTAKIIIFAQLFLAVFLFAGKVFASEKINNFDAQVTVQSDGLVNIVETIEYDFGTEQKHGIYRDIPMGSIYTIDHARRGGTRIDVGSVTDEKGNSYLRDVSDSNGIKHIKIGDPDKTITGVHKYIIDYTVTNALGYFTDYNEIYWNVTGNQWQVPIVRASATVKLPGDVQGLPDKIQCYTGFGGEKNNCDSVIPYHYSSAQFAQNNIMPGQGLTVAVGFAKGLVPNYTYVAKWYNEPNNYYKIALGVFILGLLLLLRKIFFVYIPKIRERTKPIITQFEPPTGMTPSEAGYIYKQNNAQDNRSLAGDILYLATEGYITIEHITPAKRVRGGQVFKSIALLVLFGGFSLIAYIFKSWGLMFIFIPFFILIFIGQIFFSKKTEKEKQFSFIQTGNALTNTKGHIQSLYSIITSPDGPKTTDQLVKEEPFYRFQSYFNQARISANPNSLYIDINKMWTLGGTLKMGINVVKGVFKLFFGFFIFFVIIFTLIAAPNIISGITGVGALIVASPIFVILGLFALFKIAKYFYKKRITKTGDEYYAVMGLYRYIKIAEKDRLMFEHNTSDLPKVFSKLLPFAVAFGLGNKWVQVFNGLLISNPDWYHGTTNSFSSTAFASSISGLSSSISSTSLSGAPSSDGDFGGSGGGGSSGGGGGGGGGGSW